MIESVELVAGNSAEYYKSDLFEDIRHIRNWQSVGNGQKVYEHGIHKFTVTDTLVVYKKKNIGKLSIKSHHQYDKDEGRWLQLFLIHYHDKSYSIMINTNDDWQKLFSGMDISKRLFTYIGSGNIEFGDLVPDILAERPPRYVYLTKDANYSEMAQWEHLFSGILYISCPEIYWLTHGLFPNFERAYVAHRGIYLNNQLEYLSDGLHYNGGEYLLRLPSRDTSTER
jgi:hypothetical protein